MAGKDEAGAELRDAPPLAREEPRDGRGLLADLPVQNRTPASFGHYSFAVPTRAMIKSRSHDTGTAAAGGMIVGVKEQMLQVLGSNETRRIHFSFRGTSGAQITVDQSSFRRVVTAISNDQISIAEGRFSSDIAMYSAFADSSSNSAANTFYLGRNPRWSRTFNALIVHESVHASFDLTRTSIRWIDNEAAAYIAQGYYLRNSGYSRYRLELGSETSIGYLMVNEIIAGGDADYFLNALRDSLNSSPQYHSYIRGTFTGDG